MEIDLRELSLGLNQLLLEASAEELGLSDVDVSFLAPVRVQLDVTKVETGVMVKGEILFRIWGECCRCLETFERDLSAEIGLLFERRAETSFEKWVGSPDDDLKIVAPEECILDIGESVREAVLLELPMKFMCSEECAGLCPICGTNLNSELCDCSDEQMDSAWSALESLRETLTNQE